MTPPEKRIYEGIVLAWGLSADERATLLGPGPAADQRDRLALVARCGVGPVTRPVISVEIG